jgi:hypothetical protein
MADYEGIYEISSSGMTHCLGDHFPLGIGHSIFNAVRSQNRRRHHSMRAAWI